MVLLLLTFLLAPTAQAAGVPAALTEKFFFELLTKNTYGLRLTRAVLGAEALERVTAKEFGLVLETLAVDRNARLAEDLASRVATVKEASKRSPKVFLATLEKELSLVASSSGGVRFANGESYVIARADPTAGAVARAKFLQEAAAAEAQLKKAYTWSGMDLRPEVKTELQGLLQARQQVHSDRLVMRLDGTPGAEERVRAVARSFIKAVAKFEAFAVRGASLRPDEAKLWEKELRALGDLGISSEAEAYLSHTGLPEDSLLVAKLRKAEQTLHSFR